MRHFVDRVAFQKRRGKGTEVLLEKQLERAGRTSQPIKRRRR